MFANLSGKQGGITVASADGIDPEPDANLCEVEAVTNVREVGDLGTTMDATNKKLRSRHRREIGF